MATRTEVTVDRCCNSAGPTQLLSLVLCSIVKWARGLLVGLWKAAVKVLKVGQAVRSLEGPCGLQRWARVQDKVPRVWRKYTQDGFEKQHILLLLSSALQFLEKNLHSIMECRCSYTDMVQEDLLLVLLQSIFCSVAPWWKTHCLFWNCLLALSKTLPDCCQAISPLVTSEKLTLETGDTSHESLLLWCENLLAHRLGIGNMPEITAVSGISQLSWAYRCKYVSVVCLLDVVMKLAEFGLSIGGWSWHT